MKRIITAAAALAMMAAPAFAQTAVGGFIAGNVSSTNWANSGASNDGGGSIAGKGYTATNSNQFSTSNASTGTGLTNGQSFSTSNTYGSGSTFSNAASGKGGFDYSGSGNSAAASTATVVGAIGGFTTSGF